MGCSVRGRKADILHSHLLVVLVLGTVFKDAGECSIVEIALLVNGRLSEELVHLFVRKPVAHRGEQLPQVLLLDDTWGSYYFINLFTEN